jgi:Sec-independent protein translocase protein TatA
MNFLGIGPFELLLVLVIATIVLGPERMAQAGRMLGRLYAQYRLRWQKDVDEMTRELRRELAMLQQEVEGIRQTAENEIKTAQTAIESVADIKLVPDAADKDSDTSQPAVAAAPEPVETGEPETPEKESAPAEDETDEVES